MMGLMAEPFPMAKHVPQGLHARLERDFAHWMASEQRRVYSICQHMLRDRDEADSATQDAFLKAYRALRKPDAVAPSDAGKWIARIAVNTCLDRLRSRRWQFWRQRRAADDPQAALGLVRSAAPEAEDRYFARQIQARLDAAVERLSLRQRAVFSLRHYEDLTIEEIAEVLELDPGTVKAHMHRALEKLRAELRDLYGSEPPSE
jgi:RNA polymerase sigma-70 factor (ECF subfamily)